MNDRVAVREFVKELLHRNGHDESFTDDEHLISNGWIQSVDTLEVLLFLEEKYGIDFGEAGFDQNQVESIDNMMELIASNAK